MPLANNINSCAFRKQSYKNAIEYTIETLCCSSHINTIKYLLSRITSAVNCTINENALFFGSNFVATSRKNDTKRNFLLENGINDNTKRRTM